LNVFVYGDESGVFDKAHNAFFVFGGIILLDKGEKDSLYRQFISAERKIAAACGLDGVELKACKLSNKHKASLFRLAGKAIRYGFVVDQARVRDTIFMDKKSKQRFLDYVYKVGLKRILGGLVAMGDVPKDGVEGIYIRFDEHSTATNGRYELREGIESELKRGTHNYDFRTFHPPLFPGMRGPISLEFKDSASDALIRASDIVANRVWHHAESGMLGDLNGKVLLTRFP